MNFYLFFVFFVININSATRQFGAPNRANESQNHTKQKDAKKSGMLHPRSILLIMTL